MTHKNLHQIYTRNDIEKKKPPEKVVFYSMSEVGLELASQTNGLIDNPFQDSFMCSIINIGRPCARIYLYLHYFINMDQ